MSDITMCKGGECSIKDTCYRFTATPDTYQSFFVEPPFQKKMDGTACGYYWYNRINEQNKETSHEPN